MKPLEYSKKEFTNNIWDLAEERGETSVDVDEAAGVSRGYFSRLRNAVKEIAPAAVSVVAVSNYLHTPIDTLVSASAAGMTKEDELFEGFMQKLIEDTRAGKLEWIPVSDSHINDWAGRSLTGDEYWVPQEYSEGCYSYKGQDGHTMAHGYSYYAKLDEDNLIGIIRTGDKDAIEYDVFMDGKKGLNPVGTTSSLKPLLAVRVRVLYQEAALSRSHVHISETCREMLGKVFS